MIDTTLRNSSKLNFIIQSTNPEDTHLNQPIGTIQGSVLIMECDYWNTHDGSPNSLLND